MYIIGYFFSDKEKELLDKIERQNSEELLSWKLPNLAFPITVVVISIGCYFAFKEETSTVGAINLILNGSLPMFALNRMSSVGINLFKFDKSREVSASTNTYNLRVKINEISRLMIFGLMAFYIYQVINTPFKLSCWMLFQVGLAILTIHFTLILSRFSFLLQERLVERTLGDDIRDETIEAKNHLTKKYTEDAN